MQSRKTGRENRPRLSPPIVFWVDGIRVKGGMFPRTNLFPTKATFWRYPKVAQLWGYELPSQGSLWGNLHPCLREWI